MLFLEEAKRNRKITETSETYQRQLHFRFALLSVIETSSLQLNKNDAR